MSMAQNAPNALTLTTIDMPEPSVGGSRCPRLLPLMTNVSVSGHEEKIARENTRGIDLKKKLKVKGLSGNEGRSDLIRLNWQDRNDEAFPRWSVAILKLGKTCRYVVVLGQDDHSGFIELDYDHRQFFQVKKGDEREFELIRAGIWGNIVYLLTARDPMLRLPAIISIVSFGLGLIAFLPMIMDLIKWLMR